MTVLRNPATPSAAPETPPPSRRHGARVSAPVLAVLTGTLALAYHGSRYGNWIVDDAAITFAYARSVSEGLGPVAQAGADPVEGFSNPTWMALLALGRLLGLFDRGALLGVPDYVAFPKAVALLCCVGILVAAYRVFGAVTRHAWLPTVVFGVALAAVPSFVIWSFSGLENALYALLVVWLATVLFLAVLGDRLCTTRVAVVVGVLAGAAALTRPEGLIYAGTYPFVLLLALPRTRAFGRSVGFAALSTAVFAVPVGGYFLWRYVTFGRWLPNTAVAKDQALPGIDNLLRTGELVAYVGTPIVLVTVGVVGIVLGRPVWWRRGLLTLLVPTALAVLAYVVLQPDWMGEYRFATPIWPLALLVGVLAGTELLSRGRTAARAAVSAALVVTLVPTGLSFVDSGREFASAPTVPTCRIADRFGVMFNVYADTLGVRDGSVLMPDVGGTLLTSRLEVVDQAGLVDAEVAGFYGAGDMAGLRDHVFDEVRPTFIHSHGAWSAGTGLPDDPRLARDYTPVHVDPDDGRSNADWVRRDAVPDRDSLDAVRAYAEVTIPAISAEPPRRHCGPTLHPGRTETGTG